MARVEKYLKEQGKIPTADVCRLVCVCVCVCSTCTEEDLLEEEEEEEEEEEGEEGEEGALEEQQQAAVDQVPAEQAAPTAQGPGSTDK